MQYTRHNSHDESEPGEITRAALWSKHINTLLSLPDEIKEFSYQSMVPAENMEQSVKDLQLEIGSPDFSSNNYKFWGVGVMMMTYDNKVNIDGIVRYSMHKRLTDIIEKSFKKHVAKAEKTGYLVIVNHGSITISGLPAYYLGSKLERGNYNKDVLRAYDAIVKDFKKPQPMGRLALFSGVPGSGKTYLMRGLIEELESTCKVVMLSAELAGKLGDPATLTAFINSNTDKKPMVLVIEDGDHLLVPREKGSLPVISTILQATDGLLGQLLNLRIVITTNAKNQEWDSAFMRKMRLSGCVEVNHLDRETSDNIYRRITGRDAREGYNTLAEAYYAAMSSVEAS